jgi:uncharacterized protein
VSAHGQSDTRPEVEKERTDGELVCVDSPHAPDHPKRWRGHDLASAPLDVQKSALVEFVRADPDLMAIVRTIRDLRVPDAWLTAGAVYQTVWNTLTGMPRRHGIKDYDVCYFDASDRSAESQREVGERILDALAASASETEKNAAALSIDCVNQARVHLWFEEEFGFAMPPFESTPDSLTRYACTHHAVAVQLRADGELRSLHPFGLDDVFGMRIRPNRLYPNQQTHHAKGARARALWPAVVVEPW